MLDSCGCLLGPLHGFHFPLFCHRCSHMFCVFCVNNPCICDFLYPHVFADVNT